MCHAAQCQVSIWLLLRIYMSFISVRHLSSLSHIMLSLSARARGVDARARLREVANDPVILRFRGEEGQVRTLPMYSTGASECASNATRILTSVDHFLCFAMAERVRAGSDSLAKLFRRCDSVRKALSRAVFATCSGPCAIRPAAIQETILSSPASIAGRAAIAVFLRGRYLRPADAIPLSKLAAG